VFTLAALGLSADLVLPVSAIAGAGSGPERSYPIPAADSVNIDRKSQVILVRYANRVYAFALACPHEHAAVKWLAKDHRFQCTKHDSQYTPDGKYTIVGLVDSAERDAASMHGDDRRRSHDRSKE